MPVALILPEPAHLAAFSGVRPGELQREAEHQRVPCPKRAQAGHAEYGSGHRSVDQQQPGAAADQAEHRTHDDPGQDQSTDHVEPTVPNGTNGYAKSREHPAQQQGRHGRHAGGAQQAVGRKGGHHVEDHNHRDGAEPATALRRGIFSRPHGIARVHDEKDLS